MAHLGHYISGAGHVGLIGFLLVGPLFTSEPLPFEVANVSVVTSEEFAALTEQPSNITPAPQPVEPPAPIVEDAPPEPVPQVVEEAPDEAPPTPIAPAPEPETVPEPPAPPAPVEPPQSEVSTLVAPEAIEVPDAPERSIRPRLRPAPRVAPEPVAQPEPDTTIAETTQDAISPEPSEEASEVQEAQEATAEEAASTEIVTEAEEGPPAAPERSIRPQARPSRPARQVAESPDTSEAVNAALEEALSGGSEDTISAPSGPPLTSGEREGLIVAVQDCWVVDVGSPAARVVVTVAMEMNRDGTVAGGVRLVSAEGGDARAQEVAYQSARRAVLRCQRGGYDLPADKFEQWKEIEITFNPERMRVR